MSAKRSNEDVNELFQLPLGEFTAARNALAKRAGADGAAIRQLSRPPVAAWAVNQLYWRDRKVYDVLIESAEALRKAHKAVLAGRGADLRAAGRTHDQALDAALKATLSILTSSGHPASDATRQAIVSTLRALPGDEPAGRLTRTLQPGGFEALAGFPIAARSGGSVRQPQSGKGAVRETHGRAGTVREAPAPARTVRKPPVDRKAVEKATSALRLAEHEAKREEFERARAARDADKAQVAVERAREAVERARQELEEAEEAAKAAATQRDEAERRAAASEQKLDAARAALEQLREGPAGQ